MYGTGKLGMEPSSRILSAEKTLAIGSRHGIMFEMKYLLAFLLGMITCYYIAPPTPSVEVDALTKQQIAFEVVELLEANHFDTLETLRLIAEPKKAWYSL